MTTAPGQGSHGDVEWDRTELGELRQEQRSSVPRVGGGRRAGEQKSDGTE